MKNVFGTFIVSRVLKVSFDTFFVDLLKKGL